MSVTRWIATTLTGFVLVLAGCGGGGGGDVAAPPSGWSLDESRMWKEGVDTSEVFRDMESLSGMGVLDENVTLSSGRLSQEQFKKAIKQSLEKFYRSNPTVIDSLFEEHAAPKLEGADLSNAVEGNQLKPKLLNEYKKTAYDAVKPHYRQAQLQGNASIKSIPDSLRTEENSGRFELQVHVDTTGNVDAVTVIEGGGSPTFNAILMNAATRTTWQAACLQKNDKCTRKVAGWGRMPLSIPPPRN
jgi:hypothetical protein